MTTADLIARYRALVAYDLDSTLGPLPDPEDGAGNESFDAGVVGYLNEAMAELAETAWLTDPQVNLTLTAGVGLYPFDSSAFSARVLTPYSVVVGGRRLTNASGAEYALWSLAELTRAYPTWTDDPAGETVRAVSLGDALLLHPKPAANGVALVDARVAPPPLDVVQPDASPALPTRLHPAIAGLAVYRSCLPYAQSGAQVSRLQALLAEANEVAESVGRVQAAARLGNGATNVALRHDGLWM